MFFLKFTTFSRIIVKKFPKKNEQKNAVKNIAAGAK